MLKNIMTQFQNLKSTFLLPLWRVLEHLLDSMLVVFWLMWMILCLVFLVVIWLLEGMLLKGLALVLMLVEYEVSMRGYEGVRFNTPALFLSLKNLRQRLSVALKTEYGAVVLLFTSLFGTRK